MTAGWECSDAYFKIHSNMQVEGIQVHANEGGVTQTRGGAYWLILPAGCTSLFPSKTLHSEHSL